MPAGSGPQVVNLSAVAVGTTETVVATLPPGNWNETLGMLLEFAGSFTPPATAGSLVLRIRQTPGTGTQVGPTITIPVASATVTQASISAVDTSAFGQSQQAGQYYMTATYAAATGGTLTGVLTQETIAPIQ